MKRSIAMLSLIVVLGVTALAQSSSISKGDCKACSHDKCATGCPDGCSGDCCPHN